MPSIYFTENGDNIKFEYDSDDEYGWQRNPFSQASVLTRLPARERPIAGSKRVARYRDRMEHLGYKGSGQLFQSITAHPALSSRSFEELRVECYAQSIVAQGKPPASVDAMTTPEAVIPPLFNPYPDEIDDILPNEITMAD